MSDSVYPNNPDISGFIVTFCMFLASLITALWLDSLYGIDGIIWVFPIVMTSSVLALFALDKRHRRLEVEKAMFFKKNILKVGCEK